MGCKQQKAGQQNPNDAAYPGLIAARRVYPRSQRREGLKDKGIRACIPGRKQRKTAVRYDKRPNRIEIMFGRPKDWR